MVSDTEEEVSNQELSNTIPEGSGLERLINQLQERPDAKQIEGLGSLTVNEIRKLYPELSNLASNLPEEDEQIRVRVKQSLDNGDQHTLGILARDLSAKLGANPDRKLDNAVKIKQRMARQLAVHLNELLGSESKIFGPTKITDVLPQE